MVRAEGGPQHDPAAHLAWRIHRQDYDKPGATFDVWNAALSRVDKHAEHAGINDEIPKLISSLFRRAIALGHGSRDLATVIEVLRRPALSPAPWREDCPGALVLVFAQCASSGPSRPVSAATFALRPIVEHQPILRCHIPGFWAALSSAPSLRW
jgi:hypothetical protein